MGQRVAIILSGCGQRDGSEIHESVLAILAVVKAGAEPVFFAPAAPQARVFDHVAGRVAAEDRSMLVEAARIARGQIRPLSDLQPAQVDAALFPGGFGAALNLSTFGEQGEHCTVLPEVARIIKALHGAGKPLGFICIAPVIAARVLGAFGVELTIGSDPETARQLEAMGARHVVRSATEIAIDRNNRVVSTPAYMLAGNIAEAEAGISALVEAVLQLTGQGRSAG